MKRGTPRHPKTYALAEALDIPLYAAVGILEMLWHFAAQSTPRGDIGSLPASAIASGVEWKKKPIALLEALEKCHWLDRDENNRLVLHDWPQHCDQTVVKLLEYQDKDFLSYYGNSLENRKRNSRTSHPSREAKALVEVQEFLEPEQEQEVKTKPPEIAAIMDETLGLYEAAGVPVAPKHQNLAMQLLVSSNSQHKERLPAFVRHQLKTGRWSSVATTKGLLNLLRDGDWDVPTMERTIAIPDPKKPKFQEPNMGYFEAEGKVTQ